VSADALDALMRRVDEDRWLAARFAPAPARTRLIALYALNYEIARTAEAVSQPTLGDIRLAWLREAIEEVHAGKSPRTLPALEAYARAQSETPFDPALWRVMFNARGRDLEPNPFSSWGDVTAYIDATAGGLAKLAFAACGAKDSSDLALWCGRAWGFTGLMRAHAFWRARGREMFPAGTAPEEGVAWLLAHARIAHQNARARSVPSKLFPACGYVALVPAYLNSAPSLLSRQWRLVFASATGLL